jgi:hypothetical protein
MSARGTTNTDSRGSSYSRRARKVYLLARFGDGYTAPCHFCLIELDWFTITVDRILPGALGGRYIRSNIRPACISCNSVDGTALRGRLKAARA